MSQSRVLVSGGTRGIGQAIAAKFMDAGSQVAVCGRDESRLADLLSNSPQLTGYVADVSIAKESAGLAEKIARDFGGLDVLVNNAGFFRASALGEESDDGFEEVVRGNLYSAFYLTKAMLPFLRSSARATIINICSVASIRGYPSGGAYCAAKHALLGASRALREELRPVGIAVVSILPGATLTDSWSGSGLPEERFMRPTDVAEVAFLAHRLSGQAVLEEVLMRPHAGDIA